MALLLYGGEIHCVSILFLKLVRGILGNKNTQVNLTVFRSLLFVVIILVKQHVMAYNFEIIGIMPILTFFNHQQATETNPKRSKAYLGSYHCTLDAFIESTQMIPQKPQWDWDKVIETTIDFWLKHEQTIKHWKLQLDNTNRENLIVARITNFDLLRDELENLLQE